MNAGRAALVVALALATATCKFPDRYGFGVSRTDGTIDPHEKLGHYSEEGYGVSVWWEGDFGVGRRAPVVVVGYCPPPGAPLPAAGEEAKRAPATTTPPAPVLEAGTQPEGVTPAGPPLVGFPETDKAAPPAASCSCRCEAKPARDGAGDKANGPVNARRPSPVLARFERLGGGSSWRSLWMLLAPFLGALGDRAQQELRKRRRVRRRP